MAKIVIVAPSDADVKDAVKLLKGAGHDVDVEEPTPKSLLHIVLALMAPNAYGFGPGYAYTPGDKADDDSENDDNGDKDDAEVDDAADADTDGGGDADFNFESLGMATIDGELVEAFRVKGPTSKLMVANMTKGSKTTYSLNESIFSFWPANVEAPAQRVEIYFEKHRTSMELVIEGAETPKLLVGDDLISMFEAKKQ